MKKNFLMVAALLIAAMLMVVSCTQEVAPKNELVMASVGVAYGKDVVLDYQTDAEILYQYKLTAQWNQLTNGSKPYGESADYIDMFGNNVKKLINATSENLTTNLNYVTPGYWLVEVRGLVDNKVVLEGSTKAYFNNSTPSATVYVAPVNQTEATGEIHLVLQMEDLDADDAADDKPSKIYYYLDNDVPLAGAEKLLDKGDVVVVDTVEKAAHNYSLDVRGVTAGYHTITIKVKGYEGGITKSFLMIPGNDVTFTGSVYPSKFIDSSATIQVVSIGEANIKVGEGETASLFDSASVEPVEVTGGSGIKVSIGDFTTSITGGEFSYDWYINDEKQNVASNSKTVTITAPTVPGEYNITCVAKYTYSSDTIGLVTVYGNSAFAGKIIVQP